MIKRIIIYPGHGDVDVRAVNGNIYEKDLNLKISEAMYDEFKKLGIPVYITRTGDETLNQTNRIKRVKSFTNTLDNMLIISNHVNAGGGEGAEVIYSLRNNSRLSNLILDNLSKSGLKKRKSYQKSLSTNPKKDYYYILRDTSPAESIIVEYGFIDNPKDLKLMNNNYKELAQDVVDAVVEYLGLNLGTYKVKKGDSLYKIAIKYKTSVENLKDLNNLKSNIIYINQELKVPNVYKVKKGDSLYKIAQQFNTTVKQIMKDNNLSSDVIQINQQLIV